MKYFFSFLFIIFFKISICQPSQGYIKTKVGFLMYDIDGANSFTLDFKENIDLSKAPFYIRNNNFFQLFTVYKSDYGKDSKSILTLYMYDELKYYQEQLETKLTLNNKFENINGMHSNFWEINHPVVKLKDNIKSVKSTYFLDFIHNDLIFRLVFASVTGNDIEAKSFLLDILSDFKFYNQTIDLDKLRNNIKIGIHYYE